MKLKLLYVFLVVLFSIILFSLLRPIKENYKNDFVSDGDDVKGDDMTDANDIAKDGDIKYTPLGISKSNIPKGKEDLYVLKSQIVPPVCPACPSVINCPEKKSSGGASSSKSCAPCPPCARCPEPAFECKKVPNYSAANKTNGKNILPRPILTNFSSFGM